MSILIAIILCFQTTGGKVSLGGRVTLGTPPPVGGLDWSSLSSGEWAALTSGEWSTLQP